MSIDLRETSLTESESITAERNAYNWLTVVIPAYNEALRIRSTIADASEVLNSRFGTAWELIVVDDGSNDATAKVVQHLAHLVPSLRVLAHSVNRGKGAAVRTGVLATFSSPTGPRSGSSNGVHSDDTATSSRLILFADADGATPFREIHKLIAAIGDNADLAIGSRWGPSHAAIRRTRLRAFTAWIFRHLVRMLTGTSVKDTQCGFKLFRHDVAQQLFSESSETGYLFDQEILAVAQQHGMVVREVHVEWREVPGSKVRLVRDSWKMFCGLLRIRRRMQRIRAARSQESTGGSLLGSLARR